MQLVVRGLHCIRLDDEFDGSGEAGDQLGRTWRLKALHGALRVTRESPHADDHLRPGISQLQFPAESPGAGERERG
jgi:hypothetical protein